MTDSVVFYKSFYDAIGCFAGDAFLQVEMYEAIFEYVFNDNEMKNMKPEVEAVFSLVRPQIDANMKRRTNGSKGGRPTKKNHRLSDAETIGYENVKNEKPNVNVNDNDNGNVNVNVNENVNDNDPVKKNTKFIPPTVEEVRAYCRERNNTVDAETFVDFYIGKGWMVGKNKMKDWKAAVRTWEKNRKQEQSNGDRLNDFMLNYINSQEE